MSLVLAIQALLALLPTYLIRFKIGPLPTTLLELLFFAVLVMWLWQSRRQLKSKLTAAVGKANWLPWLWVLIGLLACWVSNFSWSALGLWRAYFLEPVILFLIIQDVFKKEAKSKLIWPLWISAIVVAGLAVFQKTTGWLTTPAYCPEALNCRATGFYGYPNAVGLYLEIVICLLVGLFFALKNKAQRLFLLGGIILCLDAIIAARSRGAALGLAIGLGVFFLVYSRLTRKIVVGVVLTLWVIIMAVTPWRQALIESVSMQGLSGQIRLQQWSETWRMLSDHRLITGAGLANYKQTVKPYHVGGLWFNFTNDPDYLKKITENPQTAKKTFWRNVEIYIYPHNLWLNFWSELGLAGLLLFALIVVKFFVQAVKRYRLSSQQKYLILGAMAAMIALLVHGLVDVPYFKNDLSILFWLLFVFI